MLLMGFLQICKLPGQLTGVQRDGVALEVEQGARIRAAGAQREAAHGAIGVSKLFSQRLGKRAADASPLRGRGRTSGRRESG